MKERLLFYVVMEIINYAILPYEVYLVGFSFEQSLICRLFASLTDLVVVIFFFNTKSIWDPEKENKTIKDHLLAGVKLLVQFPIIYILKVMFVNSVAIPKLQNLGFEIERISWSNIGVTIVMSVLFCLAMGVLYSVFRERILSLFGLLKKRN